MSWSQSPSDMQRPRPQAVTSEARTRLDRHDDVGLVLFVLSLHAHSGRLRGSSVRSLLRKTLKRIRPSEHTLQDQQNSDDHEDSKWNEAVVPILPVIVALDERGDGQRHHAHQLDEDVQGWARRVLEWVTDGVSHDARLALLRLLDLQFLAKLLAVVPGATSIAHQNGQHAACDERSSKHAHQTLRPDEEADEDRRKDCVATW